MFFKDENYKILVCPNKCEYRIPNRWNLSTTYKRKIEYDPTYNKVTHPFCPLCGQKLTEKESTLQYYRCSQCGRRVPGNGRFCPHCGLGRDNEGFGGVHRRLA